MLYILSEELKSPFFESIRFLRSFRWLGFQKKQTSSLAKNGEETLDLTNGDQRKESKVKKGWLAGTINKVQKAFY